MRTSKIEYAPRAESGPIFNFYMGKNTPERKDYIMDSLVVLMVAEPCPVVPGTSVQTTGGVRLVALCKLTFMPAVQFSVNIFPANEPTKMLPSCGAWGVALTSTLLVLSP